MKANSPVTYRFSATIYSVGINRCVDVPPRVSKSLGKDKYIPANENATNGASAGGPQTDGAFHGSRALAPGQSFVEGPTSTLDQAFLEGT